jgi:hypothetical protein
MRFSMSVKIIHLIVVLEFGFEGIRNLEKSQNVFLRYRRATPQRSPMRWRDLLKKMSVRAVQLSV